MERPVFLNRGEEFPFEILMSWSSEEEEVDDSVPVFDVSLSLAFSILIRLNLLSSFRVFILGKLKKNSDYFILKISKKRLLKNI